MMEEEKTKKRLGFLINLFYFVAIGALILLAFRIAIGWLIPFIIGFLFAIVLDPVIRFLSRKMKIKRTLWSIVLVLVIWGILALILFKIGQIVYDQAAGLLNALNTAPINQIYQNISGWLTDLIKNNLPSLYESIDAKMISDTVSSIGSELISVAQSILSGLTGFVMSLPDFLISLIVTIMASIFISIDYPNIRTFLAAQLSKRNRGNVLETKDFFKNKIFSIVRAYAIIITITFIELFIGFTIIGLNNALLMALLISLLDLLPIVGTATFLVPWGIIVIIQGDLLVGIGLIVIAIVVSVIREAIQPKIVGSQIGLNPLLTLLTMYVGLKVFGLLGMFLVPLTAIFLKNLNDTGRIHLWKTPDSEVIATVEKVDEAEEIMRKERALQRKNERMQKKKEHEERKQNRKK
mgnify:CR=1 FL=1